MIPNPVAGNIESGARRRPTGLSRACEPSMAQATIDLAAIGHNTSLLRKACSGAQLMAVVKANGFGHGAVEIARTALAHGASWLGVTSQAEAMALRLQGIDAPMLMWLYGPHEDLAHAVSADVSISVASMAQLALVANTAQRTGTHARIHLKIDTGLSRSGILPQDWRSLAGAARRMSRAGLLSVEGVWSHLANAEDTRDTYIDEQYQRFSGALGVCRELGLAPAIRHIANSVALLRSPGLRLDLVRVGPRALRYRTAAGALPRAVIGHDPVGPGADDQARGYGHAGVVRAGLCRALRHHAGAGAARFRRRHTARGRQPGKRADQRHAMPDRRKRLGQAVHQHGSSRRYRSSH
ncbi:MAG: alanine racemase [Burkholderia sp.]